MDGDDYLEGRGGDDRLEGGNGSDHYLFDGRALGADFLVEAPNQDRDVIDLSKLGQGVVLGVVDQGGLSTIGSGGSATTSSQPGASLDLRASGMQTVHENMLRLEVWHPDGIEDLIGTPGNDTLRGNDRDNEILGRGGNDVLEGAGGNDLLDGGDGNDQLRGGFGDDTLRGGPGNDALAGDFGDDTLWGDGGDDTLEGGIGNDTLYGNHGDDLLHGNSGNDYLGGWDGDDRLFGDAGDDTLSGGNGNDELDGGSGSDRLLGGDGNDLVDGGAGIDNLDGGAGRDTLLADRGNEHLKLGERIEITVDGTQPQDDSWSCGPNSGSRLLRSYGKNVSYGQLRNEAESDNIISDFGLGTPAHHLRDIMGKYAPDTTYETGSNFQKVIDLLAQGRPVIALIGWGQTILPPIIPFVPEVAPEKLHYVVLTGFDQQTQQIFYTDTDGQSKVFSYSEFQDKWDWPGEGTTYAHLSILGVKKQTIVWVPVEPALPPTVSFPPGGETHGPADLNGDGSVDAGDAAALIANWGQSGIGDLNHDGIVDAVDAAEIFAAWTGDATPRVPRS